MGVAKGRQLERGVKEGEANIVTAQVYGKPLPIPAPYCYLATSSYSGLPVTATCSCLQTMASYHPPNVYHCQNQFRLVNPRLTKQVKVFTTFHELLPTLVPKLLTTNLLVKVPPKPLKNHSPITMIQMPDALTIWILLDIALKLLDFKT